MRRLTPLLGAVLLFAACTEGGDGAKSGGKERRPGGMSEEIWKIYSGAESGLADAPKDKPQDAKPPEKK
jgi:hypothetical protein